MGNPKRAFTFIELLIVVAIIAILAAIAIPNFLEAQVRSKISRSMTDMRTIATALETYRVDFADYPPPVPYRMGGLAALSTPVAYVSSVPRDPFGKDPPGHPYYNFWQNAYVYTRLLPEGYFVCSTYIDARSRGCAWGLAGRGPDRRQETNDLEGGMIPGSRKETRYNPTNGTLSRGDIERFGP